MFNRNAEPIECLKKAQALCHQRISETWKAAERQKVIFCFPISQRKSGLIYFEECIKEQSYRDRTLFQNLSAKLYSALRLLRATILGESGDNVLAHHVFCNSLLQLMSKKVPRTKEKLLELNGMSKAKVSNYGDQILETIENTINEYYKLDKSSNGSANSAKRRRDANGGLDRNLEDDDELTKKIKMCIQE
ncbi:ATP-dependent DNA helicase Q-like 4A [Arachis hypogaea]|nr:ATP-dependent DNA helicase Q-like 4A [Arachis hypogaea]